jgi:pyroglutamyl-peptidase
MRAFLIGFGPFPGAPFNPSAALATALARRRRPALAEIDRKAHVFATTYAAVNHELPRLLAEQPDVVLMFGLAARRRQLCIETRARNAVSVLFPDARGYRPLKGAIAPGAHAVRGHAPFASLLGALRGSALPARLSGDAGRYLCNYAYWRALDHARDGVPLVALVHIPMIGFGTPRLPRRPSSFAPSFPALVAAAEKLLIVLAAASRQRPPLHDARPLVKSRR